MALVAVNLCKTFAGGKVAADHVSLRVARGDFVAVVGESGSGKSTAARMMLKLLAQDSGRVTFNGQDVAGLDKEGMKRFRAKVQAVFQDPSGALNPRKRIRTILGEVAEFYGIAKGRSEIEALCVKMLEQVGLRPGAVWLDRFPHELSGGQRQRVLIAKSMIPQPDIIIADEAVSALDVSVKAGVLRLMEDLRKTAGVGYLLISHDLPVVRKVASYVYVMRAGLVRD
jgi:ABC-type glutathione transport system ATPase component